VLSPIVSCQVCFYMKLLTMCSSDCLRNILVVMHCLATNVYLYTLVHGTRCIYAYTVEVTSDIAQDLLRAADQYLLEGLKRLCEYIAQVSLWKTLHTSPDFSM
jgi:hypothetical protein